MPMAEWICANGHRIERLLSREEFDNKEDVICENEYADHANKCGARAERVEFSMTNMNMGENFSVHNATDPTKLVKEFSVFGAGDNRKVDTQTYRKLSAQISKIDQIKKATRKL
jgi:hypothetical protein